MDPGILSLLPPAYDPAKSAETAKLERRKKSKARRDARREAKTLLADVGKTPRKRRLNRPSAGVDQRGDDEDLVAETNRRGSPY